MLMKNLKTASVCGLMFLTGLGLPTTQALAGENMYSVTITNLTRGVDFTPILVISHKPGHPVFNLGDAPSDALARIAEGGDTSLLEQHLLDAGMAKDSGSSDGLLGPGASVTVTVMADEQYNYLSVASMLLPTNDGFFAVNGIALPKGKRMKTVYSPAYDAGSEDNDELCASIPGPACGGEPFSDGLGEGFVHIHSGIHGIADLNAAKYDWRNPVAKISIKRMK